MNSHARAVDHNNPLPPTNLPRGYGGVAILWKQHLDRFITRTDDGNQRVITCLFDNGSQQLCIISAYFPSGSSTQAKSEFTNTLDLIFSIISKYSETHRFLISTDLNHDLFKHKHHNRSRVLEFLQELRLTVLSDGQIPTMYSTCGRYQSCLDYFMTDSIDILKENNGAAKVLDMAPGNTSAHTAISIKIPVLMPTISNTDTKIQTNRQLRNQDGIKLTG